MQRPPILQNDRPVSMSNGPVLLLPMDQHTDGLLGGPSAGVPTAWKWLQVDGIRLAV
jgi:hypothetical protein